MSAKLQNVEDVYPLSPMQEMMLLHELSRTDSSVLFNQFCYEAVGELDVDRFRHAWDEIVARNEALRTAFVWSSSRDPLQIVRRQVSVPFREFDWRPMSPAEQQRRLDQFCREDRKAGFDLRKAPLMRVAVARTAPDRCYVIWSSHHLVVDHWCLSILFDQLLASYESRLPAAGPAFRYRQYIEWLQRRDTVTSEAFWRTTLAGMSSSSGLARHDGGWNGGSAADEVAELRLSAGRTAMLRSFAQRTGVTISTVVQGALALTLNHYLGRQDVAFGMTVAGRPAEVPGIEHIVGSFINNVPVRTRMSADARVSAWLSDLQLDQQRRASFEHESLASIHEWSEIGATGRIFDTLLVWLGPVTEFKTEALRLAGLGSDLRTEFPLTVSAQETADALVFRALPAAGCSLIASPAGFLRHLDGRIDALVSAERSVELAALNGFKGQAVFNIDSTPVSEYASVPRAAGNANNATRILEGGRESADPDELEDFLRAEWRQLLQIEDIGSDDNFFELGGDSLKAAQLHANVESAMRGRIPMTALFETATITQMRRLLAQGNWPQSDSLVVPIGNRRGRQPGLFCIAPPEVNTVGYAMLARHLDPGLRVHVVQALPEAKQLRIITPSELTDLGARYVDAVRKVQPSGPYFFLGMCKGAHLAVEMARQLAGSGQSVQFVGVIDTHAPYTLTRAWHIAQFINYFRTFFEILRLPRGERRQTLRRIARKRLAGLGLRRRAGTVAGTELQGSSGSVEPTAPDPWIENVGWAHKDPGAPKYEGTVTVFRLAHQHYWHTRERDLGWGRQATRTEVVMLPGTDHTAITREPDVRHLGEHIRRRQRSTVPADEMADSNMLTIGVSVLADQAQHT